MNKSRTFAGHVVWITGASAGIGRALATAYHRSGAQVILSARRAAVLEDVHQALGNDSRSHILPLDLSDLDSLPGKVSEVLAAHGRVDVLVHNAAVALRDRVVDTDLAVHQRIMATNYFGPVVLTKAVLPSMLARRSGHFVVISSLSGRFGGPQGSAYAASKHALEGFFESLEAEVHDDNIRVTTVVPGFIRTSILESALTGSGQVHGRNLPVHARGMDADECARRILKGIARGRREILVGGMEMYTLYLKRFLPGLLAWLVRRHPMRLARQLMGGGKL